MHGPATVVRRAPCRAVEPRRSDRPLQRRAALRTAPHDRPPARDDSHGHAAWCRMAHARRGVRFEPDAWAASYQRRPGFTTEEAPVGEGEAVGHGGAGAPVGHGGAGAVAGPTPSRRPEPAAGSTPARHPRTMWVPAREPERTVSDQTSCGRRTTSDAWPPDRAASRRGPGSVTACARARAEPIAPLTAHGMSNASRTLTSRLRREVRPQCRPRSPAPPARPSDERRPRRR